MKYSTILNIYNICKDPELWYDFNVKSTKECVKKVLKEKTFLKSYLKSIRLDIKDCLEDIRKQDFLMDLDLTRNLLFLKNDISLYIKNR